MTRFTAPSTIVFLIWYVVFPSLAGMVVHRLAGAKWIQKNRSLSKLLSSVLVLLLCYINASNSLPSIFAEPDWDFLTMCIFFCLALCILGFFGGWLVSLFYHATAADRNSLMFGLGMNNNGTGLVIADQIIPGAHSVLLPILCYNLVQHFIAGLVQKLFCTPKATVLESTKSSWFYLLQKIKMERKAQASSPFSFPFSSLFSL